MLYIETSNAQDQALLEEEFARDGNVFGVPLKKTKPLQQRIEAIKFEIFLDERVSKKGKKNMREADSELMRRVTDLLAKFLNNRLCLATLRDIFRLIKHQEQKIELYEEHLLHLNWLIMEQEEGGEVRGKCLEEMEIEGLFQDLLQAKIRSVMTLESELNLQELRDSRLAEPPPPAGLSQLTSLRIIQETQPEPCPVAVDGDPVRMYSSSLKLEIPRTPQFKESLDDVLCHKNGRFSTGFLDDSPHSEESSISEHEMVELTKFKLSYDTSTNETMYYPSWKKDEDVQKKNLDGALNLESKGNEKSPNTSDFLENLSGRFKPLPSILNDDSISGMVKREKKEDIKKSNNFIQSVRAFDAPANQERLYQENIKMVKFQNKLNRNHLDKQRSPRPLPGDADPRASGREHSTEARRSRHELRNARSGDNLLQMAREQPLPAMGMLSSLTSFFKFKKAPIHKA